MPSLAFLALLASALHVFASPLPAGSPLEARHNRPQCIKDDLYRIVHNPKLECDASAFCSVYIASTETCTKTVHPTITITRPVTTTDATAYRTITVSQETTVTTAIPYTKVQVVTETSVDVTVDQVQTVSSDFTTTDVTVDLFYTDFETFTTTDATVFATEVDVEQFTTTDATVFATQTLEVDVTQTDLVTDIETTIVATVTQTITVAAPVKARDVQPKPNDPFVITPSAPAPTASATLAARNNAPKPKELAKAFKPFGADCLSSACSCLVKPSTYYTTKTKTGKASTITRHPTVHKTATGTRYATVPGGAVHFSGASKEVDVTSEYIVDATYTRTSTEVDVVTHDATFYTSETATRVVTDEETVTDTLTVTSVQTNDATLTATATVLVTSILDVTVVTTIDVPATATATATASPPPPSQPGCAGIASSPYQAPNGENFALNCGGFYPIQPGGLVGSGNYPTFSGCINACASNAACVGVDYDSNSGLCDLFNGNHQGSVQGFFSALLITAA